MPSKNLIELVELLKETRAILLRPENDFAWSSWDGAEYAIKEIDQLIDMLANGQLPPRLDLSVLFAPTGPIQEVSISSGWGDEFLSLATRFDRAMARAYGDVQRRWGIVIMIVAALLMAIARCTG